MSWTRRALLSSAIAVPVTAFGRDTRPCDPPRYDAWTGRRELRWPEKVGEAGFVNYYGEAYRFDAAVDVPRDHLPSCGVFGATASTLQDTHGRLREHLGDLTVAGRARTTDCTLWSGETVDDFERKVATLLEQLKSQAGDGTTPTRFHPVGSHHSSSDVYRRADDARAVVVRIDGLNALALDRPEWREDFLAARPDAAFALVGGGVLICQLNEALWELGLALETQGSFDGQSLAGAISTGTHGAGATHGAVADSIEAVILLTCTRDPDGARRWEVLQIEPAAGEGITDPWRFRTERHGAPWRLVQNATLFDAVAVSMGMLGVIAGFVMRVRRAYFLQEVRVGRPWTEIRPNFVERAESPPSGFSTDGWRYELTVNPERVAKREEWLCTEVYRNAWDYDLDYLSESREIPQKYLGGITRNVNLGGEFGKFVAATAGRGLVRGRRMGTFADRAYRVLKLGQGEFVQAWGTELMVPQHLALDLIDWILKTNPERGELAFGKRRGERLVNPFGVRFAQGRRGFLSMVRWYKDGSPGLVCTAELTEAVKDNDVRNLGVRDNGKPSSKAIVERWADDFLRTFGKDGRLHFGQVQGASTAAEVAASYPVDEIASFGEAFRVLNPFGYFDTAFAVRLGFVAVRESRRDQPELEWRS